MRNPLNTRVAVLTLAALAPAVAAGVAFGVPDTDKSAATPISVVETSSTSATSTTRANATTWGDDGIRPDGIDFVAIPSVTSSTTSTQPSVTTSAPTTTATPVPATPGTPGPTATPTTRTPTTPVPTTQPQPVGAGSPKLNPSNVISKLGPYDQGQGIFTSWVIDASDPDLVFDQMYRQMVAQGWTELQSTTESADFTKGPSAAYIETGLRPDGKVNLMLVYYAW